MGIFGWSYPAGCTGTPEDDMPYDDTTEEEESMITRDPLDLRDKTMTELMEMDREIGCDLSAMQLRCSVNRVSKLPARNQPEAQQLLTDRRQIREEMNRRREEFEEPEPPDDYPAFDANQLFS